MRVIGGSFGGTILNAPKTRATRPTADRLRESLFSILGSRLDFSGVRVLDVFGGTGALGLEAVSRGADFALFMEIAALPRALIRRNAETCGVLGRCKIYRRDATRAGARPSSAGPAFDLVFCDPPYGKGLAEKALAALRDGDWLAAGAVAVVEESRKTDFLPPQGFAEIDRRVYGDTQVIFLQRKEIKA